MSGIKQNGQKRAVATKLEVIPVKNVAILGSPEPGINPLCVEHAKELGIILGQRKLTLIYNGVSSGIIGAAVDAGITSGGSAVAITSVQEASYQAGPHHNGLTELISVPDTSTRQNTMWARSSCVVALPSDFFGLGDLFNILNLVIELKQHEHRIFLLNTENAFEPVLQGIDTYETRGYVEDGDIERRKEKVIVLSEPRDIIPYLPSLDGIS